MATATYKVGLSPPGGVWLKTNLNANPKQVAGVSIMGTNNFVTYACFMFGNTLVFHFSLYMMELLTRGFPPRLELNLATFGMTLAYCISMAAVSPTWPLGYAFYALFVARFSLPFIVPFLRDSKLSCKIRSTVKRFFTNRQPWFINVSWKPWSQIVQFFSFSVVLFSQIVSPAILICFWQSIGKRLKRKSAEYCIVDEQLFSC